MNARVRTVLAQNDWQEAERLFDECLKRPEAERASFLAEATTASPRLRAEVESLLRSAGQVEGFLESPLAGRLLDDKDLGAREAPASPVAFRPQRTGKYWLLHKLGEGGMAEVFLAKTSGPGGFEKYLAVKRVLRAYSADSEFRDMFEYEAKLCARLSHAHIVHLYDFAAVDDTYLMVMEYVAGKNLRQVVERARARGGLPLELALYITEGILRGLDYAHTLVDEKSGAQLGIIHRDVSPKNVMIPYEGSVKLLDFGIAKARDRAHLTRPGMLRGTFNYLAPETVAGGKIDARSDLFSAAVILYELVSGRPLFAESSLMASLRDIEECRLPAKRLAELDVDPGLRAILERGLCKDPVLRYPTAASFLTDLHEFLATCFSGLSDKRLAELMGNLFAEEREEERARLERLDGWLVSAATPARTKRPTRPEFPLMRPAPPSRRPRILSALLAGLGAAALGLGYLAMYRDKAPAPIAAKIEPMPRAAVPAVKPVVAFRPVDSDKCSIAFESTPADAALTVNGIEVGRTPVTVALVCNVPVEVALAHQGYASRRQSVIVRQKESRLALSLAAKP